MEPRDDLFFFLSEWWQRRQKKRQNASAPGIKRSFSRFLPSPGSILFTLLMVGLLVWAQTAGALPGLTNSQSEIQNSQSTIPYQGRLADADGNPVTDTVNMVFRLYSQASGGAPLWEEQWTGSNGVQVSDGLFNVMLGSLNPIPQDVITGHDNLFLGITAGTDDEMTPRVQLGSVPFAVQALTVPDGSIDSAKISTQGLDVPGTLRATGVLDFPDHLGWQWHDAVAFKHNAKGWATAVDYHGEGVLLMVQAFGGAFSPANRLRITVDGNVWKEYTGDVPGHGATGWNIVDDGKDDNAGIITLIPFKRFTSSLKVEVYNASDQHESEVRVNYFTPK